MKKIIICLGFLAMVLVNSARATEIATINLDEVIKNSTAMTKATKSLEVQKGNVEKRLKAEEKKLNDEKMSLENQIKTLSQDVAQEKVMAFQQKVMKFQQDVRESESGLQKSYMDAVVQITEKVKSIVAEMKNEKDGKYKYDVVLPAASVVYSDRSIDISPEVLSRLNKQLKEVKAPAKK